MKIDGTEVTITLGQYTEARKAGRRAARNHIHYDLNPFIKPSDKDYKLAWSAGHNEQRATIINGRKYA